MSYVVFNFLEKDDESKPEWVNRNWTFRKDYDRKLEEVDVFQMKTGEKLRPFLVPTVVLIFLMHHKILYSIKQNLLLTRYRNVF